MSYPDNCIRGISVTDHLTQEGTASTALFQFKERTNDNWSELSINWDDGNVLEFTFTQRKDDGELQFNVGAVVIPTNKIDDLINLPTASGHLAYERQPLPDNRYHGNILLNSNISKPLKTMLRAGLAMAVSRIVRNPA